MITKKNKNKKSNWKHYKKSDGSFMPIDVCMQCDQTLPRLKWVFDKIESHKWKSLLDVGTKDGYVVLTAAKRGLQAVGVDPAIDAIEEANKRRDELKLNCTFQPTYIELFMPDILFDVVVMLEVIDRVVDVHKVLEKCKQSGKNLLLSTPYYYGRFGFNDDRNKERIRIYKEEELRPLLERYGTIESFDMIDSAFCVHVSFK